MKDDTLYSIRIRGRRPEIWRWCCDAFAFGTWNQQEFLTEDGHTYVFINERDALLFRLRWSE